MSLSYSQLVNNKLPKEFYMRSPELVAKKLLGKILVKMTDYNLLAGIITETEAYLNANDLASHSFNGPTKRNSAMFMTGGTLYVYQIYGIHKCINVVTEPAGIGSAVLIRALVPISGIEIMKINRGIIDERNLCNGPGKISQAYGFELSNDKDNLLSDNLFISDIKLSKKIIIQKTPRIGITKSKDLMLRFMVTDKIVSI